MVNITRALAALTSAVAFAPSTHGAQVVATPSLASYGQPVQIEVRDRPAYLPATRFTRVGSIIVIEADLPFLCQSPELPLLHG